MVKKNSIKDSTSFLTLYLSGAQHRLCPFVIVIMRYIIMCGGSYKVWDKPKHLTEINGEPIVARTIRLLKEAGIKDIAISSNNDAFRQFGVPVLKHRNEYYVVRHNDYQGYWCDGFYPMDNPCCYLFGDVVFSPEAIKTIVEYETDDIMLFGSKQPFSNDYPKWYIEPFGFKVANQKHLHHAIEEVKRIDREGGFNRKPIAWETWNVICGTDPNEINQSYVAINDYTCDIDGPEEINKVQSRIKGGNIMAKDETKKVTRAKKAKAKPKAEPQVIYKDKPYKVIDENNGRLCLTDNIIHFWVKAEDCVKAE